MRCENIGIVCIIDTLINNYTIIYIHWKDCDIDKIIWICRITCVISIICIVSIISIVGVITTGIIGIDCIVRGINIVGRIVGRIDKCIIYCELLKY